MVLPLFVIKTGSRFVTESCWSCVITEWVVEWMCGCVGKVQCCVKKMKEHFAFCLSSKNFLIVVMILTESEMIRMNKYKVAQAIRNKVPYDIFWRLCILSLHVA